MKLNPTQQDNNNSNQSKTGKPGFIDIKLRVDFDENGEMIPCGPNGNGECELRNISNDKVVATLMCFLTDQIESLSQGDEERQRSLLSQTIYILMREQIKLMPDGEKKDLLFSLLDKANGN